jgi:hypothetical protein
MFKKKTKNFGLWAAMLMIAGIVPLAIGLVSFISPNLAFGADPAIVDTSLNITNTAPSFDSLEFFGDQSGLSFTPLMYGGATLGGYLIADIFYNDDQGCEDVQDEHLLVKAFTDDLDKTCTIDNNNCIDMTAYCTKTCTAGLSPGWYRCDMHDTALPYYMDSTAGTGAMYPLKTWNAYAYIEDIDGLSAELYADGVGGTGTIEVNANMAFDMLETTEAEPIIAYGTLAHGEYNDPAMELRVYNYGNANMDVSVNDGAASPYGLGCTVEGKIPTEHQKYSLNDDVFDYATEGTALTHATPVPWNLNLANRSDDSGTYPWQASDGFAPSYWRILMEDDTSAMPIKGNCTGTTTFTGEAVDL